MTFFVILPLLQVIVTAFVAGLDEALGAGVGSASWDSLIRTVGDENVKFLADRVSQPFFSFKIVVDT